METVNLKDKFSKFQDYCNPRVIGEINDCQVKAVKLKGEFIWHHHDNEDELFLVVKGTLRMKFRDREAVVREGDAARVWVVQGHDALALRQIRTGRSTMVYSPHCPPQSVSASPKILSWFL